MIAPVPAPWLDGAALRRDLAVNNVRWLRPLPSTSGAAAPAADVAPCRQVAAPHDDHRDLSPTTAAVATSLEILACPRRAIGAWAEVIHHLAIGPAVTWQLLVEVGHDAPRVRLVAHAHGSTVDVEDDLSAAWGHVDTALRAQAHWLAFSPVAPFDVRKASPEAVAGDSADGALLAGWSLGEFFTRLSKPGSTPAFTAWRSSLNDLEGIVEALSLHGAPALLAVSLRPTLLEAADRRAIAAAGQLIQDSEPLGFEARVHLALRGAPTPGLSDLLGARLFGRHGMLGALDEATISKAVGEGTFAFHWADGPSQRPKAAWNLLHGAMLAWEPGLAGQPRPRQSRLVTPLHALTVARFPLWQPDVALPGMPVPTSAQLPADGARIGTLGNGAVFRQSDGAASLHTHVLGKTGMGKSNLLLHLILQRVEEGRGVCLLDPHGELVQDVLHRLHPEAVQGRDVVVIDPADSARPVRLNILAHDLDRPESRSRAVDFVLSMIKDLYDLTTMGGPIFENTFRLALLSLMEASDRQVSVGDFMRLFSSESFRKRVIAKVKDPILRAKWAEVQAVSGHNDASLSNLAGYITSKFNPFLYNLHLRPLLAAREPSLRIGDLIEGRAIVLVNLRKGMLGGAASALLGRTVLSQYVMAAMQRRPEVADAAPCHIFVDEFQNLMTDAIAEAIAEVRKYGLRLTLAHQHLGQLSPAVESAVFGNVGTSIMLRVSPGDAAKLAVSAGCPWLAEGLTRLERFHAVVHAPHGARPLPPFVVRLAPPPEVGRPGLAEHWREQSRGAFGVAVDSDAAE